VVCEPNLTQFLDLAYSIPDKGYKIVDILSHLLNLGSISWPFVWTVRKPTTYGCVCRLGACIKNIKNKGFKIKNRSKMDSLVKKTARMNKNFTYGSMLFSKMLVM
jgi:hypothetical protein